MPFPRCLRQRTPHQSSIGSEEPMDDSFSPGRSLSPVSNALPSYTPRRKFPPKGFSLEGGAPRSESKINMIAGGNHTLIHRWQKSLIFDGRGIGCVAVGDCYVIVGASIARSLCATFHRGNGRPMVAPTRCGVIVRLTAPFPRGAEHSIHQNGHHRNPSGIPAGW